MTRGKGLGLMEDAVELLTAVLSVSQEIHGLEHPDTCCLDRSCMISICSKWLVTMVLGFSSATMVISQL